MSTRPRAALYLRMSLDQTGAGEGIERQREICSRHAEYKGWDIVAEYVDNSVSATKTRPRPGYQQLVEAAKTGAFDVVLVYKLDRLTRRPIEIEDWIAMHDEFGVNVATADGDIDLSTASGQTIAGILANIARGEVKVKSDRQKAAARQRAEKGRPPLGTRLTGYSPKGDVVAAEAAFVRSLFDRFAAGDSLRSLAAWAGEQGIATRHGRPWNPSSIRTILSNPRYAGRAVYMGEEIGRLGAWDPIVDDDVFDLVQVKLGDPLRRSQRGTDRKHLGSGLYLCGVCGTPLVSWTGDRYRCPQAHLTRAMAPIDGWVLAVIKGRLARPDLAAILAEPDGRDREAGQKVRQLRQRIARIADEYDQGLIDGHRFKMATDKAQAELAAAEAAMARASNPAAGILLAPDPVRAFEASPLMIRRALIEALCEVRVHPAPRGRRDFDSDTVDIDWKSSTSL